MTKSSSTHALYVAPQESISLALHQGLIIYFFLNLTHKTETGAAKGWRLLIATHLDQSNHLANQ